MCVYCIRPSRISTSCLYGLWDLPGDVLAAPESALYGRKGVIVSLSSGVLAEGVGWLSSHAASQPLV